MGGLRERWSGWLMITLGGFALAVSGCASIDYGEDDDTGIFDDDDDDDGADDDDDDDTSTDDDTTTDDGDWVDVLAAEDPEGDSGSSGDVDLEALQVRLHDGTLAMRMRSWTAFDPQDEPIAVRMFLGDGARRHALILDTVQTVTDELQLWSTDATLPGWARRDGADLPASLAWWPDGTHGLAIEVAAGELGLDGCALDGAVEVLDGNGLGDAAPDALWSTGAWTPFELTGEVALAIDDATFVETANPCDPSWPGADGIVDPCETLELTVTVRNTGCGPATGQPLQATLSVDDGPVVVSAATDTLATALGRDEAGALTFVVEVDDDARPGEPLALALALDDGDLGPWSLSLPARTVGYPWQSGALPAVLDDGPPDFAAPFDVATLAYRVDGDQLQLTVTSHAPHDGDQEVDVFLDVDRDGHADVAVSTWDTVTATHAGAVYRSDDDGGWSWAAELTSFSFTHGSTRATFELPLALLGAPEFVFTSVIAVDPVTLAVDSAPDDPDDEDALGVIACVERPWLVARDVRHDELAGDGDGALDPGEQWSIEATLWNRGAVPSLDTTGAVVFDGALFAVTPDTVDAGDLPAGQQSSIALTVAVDAGATPAPDHALTLALQGSGHPFELPLPIPLGPQPFDAPPVDCAALADPLLAPPPAPLAGDTRVWSDDLGDPGCTARYTRGRDAIYAVQLAAGQTLDVELVQQGGTQDPILVVLDCAGACVADSDAHREPFDPRIAEEELSFTPASAGIYLLVVDGWYEDAGGPYTIELDF